MLGMSNELSPIVRPRRRLPRVPAFFPCLARYRNGWTAKRQAHFLGHLAETGSVSAACARVGMSRKGAYKLRKKPARKASARPGTRRWDHRLAG